MNIQTLKKANSITERIIRLNGDVKRLDELKSESVTCISQKGDTKLFEVTKEEAIFIVEYLRGNRIKETDILANAFEKL